MLLINWLIDVLFFSKSPRTSAWTTRRIRMTRPSTTPFRRHRKVWNFDRMSLFGLQLYFGSHLFQSESARTLEHSWQIGREFYFIFAGLAGIDLGNMLIKSVVRHLASEDPHIKVHSTLSPMPGFRAWVLRMLKTDSSRFLDFFRVFSWYKRFMFVAWGLANYEYRIKIFFRHSSHFILCGTSEKVVESRWHGFFIGRALSTSEGWFCVCVLVFGLWF